MGSIPKSTGLNPHERCPLGFNPNRGTCVQSQRGTRKRARIRIIPEKGARVRTRRGPLGFTEGSIPMRGTSSNRRSLESPLGFTSQRGTRFINPKEEHEFESRNWARVRILKTRKEGPTRVHIAERDSVVIEGSAQHYVSFF